MRATAEHRDPERARRCGAGRRPGPRARRAHARSGRLYAPPAGARRARRCRSSSGLSQELRGLVAGHRRSAAPGLPAVEPARHESGREAADARAGQARSPSCRSVATALNREIALLELKSKIESAAQQEMTDAQRQVLPAPAAQSDSGRARRRREARERRSCGKRIAAANLPEARRRRRDARGRSAGADDAGVARIPDDPHLHRLGARRPVVDGDRGSARSGRRARRCSTRTTTISTRSKSGSSSIWRCRS